MMRLTAQRAAILETLAKAPKTPVFLTGLSGVPDASDSMNYRGRDGAFFKTGEDPQVDHFYGGIKVTDDAKFGVEPENFHGYLSTTEKSPMGKHDGPWKSEKGSYRDYYVDVVKAIKGEAEVAVKPEESRNGLRVIELAMESAKTGKTVEFTP